MENRLKISVWVLAVIILSACESTNKRTVIGTGDIESMKVELPDFTGVSVIGTCNVDIIIGEPQSLEFFAQQEILDVLTYKVVGGILQISFDPDVTVKTEKEIRAEITIPALSYIAVTGAGNFLLNGNKQENLDIFINGVGNVEAYGMIVDECTINVSGVGDCKVWVNKTLEVYISGVGNIFYKGNPNLLSEISGTGNVTKVDI